MIDTDAMDALAMRLTGTLRKIGDQERFLSGSNDRLARAAKDYQEAQKAYNGQLVAVASLKSQAEELRKEIRMLNQGGV